MKGAGNRHRARGIKPLNSSGIVTGLIGGPALALVGAKFALTPIGDGDVFIGVAFVAVGSAIAGVCVFAAVEAVRRGRGE